MLETRILPTPGVQDWRERLQIIVDTMREMSSQTDPEEMVRAYGERVQQLLPRDRLLSLSRRGHEYPELRVTRDSERRESINPWTERARLPVIRGGLLAELIYSDQPRVINDLRVEPDDPGYEYLKDQRSLMAIPLYDGGVALNMVVPLRSQGPAFRPDQLPEVVWMSNLFGRATQNLVLSEELRKAYGAVERELQVVASIQRSLLPAELPKVPGLDVAAHYQTSRAAGGDYYDFFPLPSGNYGLLIADVSGHGTPAAVMMAITHAIAHSDPRAPCPPSILLERLNRQLTRQYTFRNSTFVTAFYGVYDHETRRLKYASAGHNPPRLKRCVDQSLHVLEGHPGLPLGVAEDAHYADAELQLQRGDQLVLYTDGITEAFNPDGEMFGTERLDGVLARCRDTAQGLIQAVLDRVEAFADGRAADDDRTLLVALVN